MFVRVANKLVMVSSRKGYKQKSSGGPSGFDADVLSTPPLPASSAAAHTAATPVPARGTPAAAVDEKAAVAAIDPPWFQPLCVEARKRAQDTAFEIYSSAPFLSDSEIVSVQSDVRRLARSARSHH